MTDGGSAINDVEQIEQIAESFADQSIGLVCIGMGFGDAEEIDDDAPPSSFNDIETTSNNRQEKILRYFCHLVHGSIFDGASAIEMLKEMASKRFLQRPIYRGPLQITSTLCIPIKMYTKCKARTLFSQCPYACVSLFVCFHRVPSFA